MFSNIKNSIKEKTEKIKVSVKGGFDFENPTQRGAFLTVVLVLVASASFGLGWLSGLETVKKSVEIEFPKGQTAGVFAPFATTSTIANAPTKTSGKYVASKNGTKYHLSTCSSAKSISQKNKVWFDTKEEAEGAGYTPAANCKGM
ncbi:MAG: hypothetical protein HYT94_01015 [Parcubacteria group bacterium]|nr:hypothetical protein [Parcubacteria group bacterium]